MVLKHVLHVLERAAIDSCASLHISPTQQCGVNCSVHSSHHGLSKVVTAASAASSTIHFSNRLLHLLRFGHVLTSLLSLDLLHELGQLFDSSQLVELL